MTGWWLNIYLFIFTYLTKLSTTEQWFANLFPDISGKSGSKKGFILIMWLCWTVGCIISVTLSTSNKGRKRSMCPQALPQSICVCVCLWMYVSKSGHVPGRVYLSIKLVLSHYCWSIVKNCCQMRSIRESNTIVPRDWLLLSVRLPLPTQKCDSHSSNWFNVSDVTDRTILVRNQGCCVKRKQSFS